MTYPYAPPLDFMHGAAQSEIRDVAAIISNYTTNASAAAALARYYNGERSVRALRAALLLVDHEFSKHRGTRHAPRLRGRGTAAREIQKGEIWYRAAYVANASARLHRNLADGRPMTEALAPERRYYAAHERARRRRQDVAVAVDNAADKYGATLGWYAHHDDQTSAECRAAHGTNFRVGDRPRIGYPGSVHPHCRCTPGPPWATLNTTDETTLGMTH